jgi:hypothetical protein
MLHVNRDSRPFINEVIQMLEDRLNELSPGAAYR